MAQRMEEMLRVNPLLLFDQLLVHDRQMSGRASKGDPTQFPPEADSLLERGPRFQMLLGWRQISL